MIPLTGTSIGAAGKAGPNLQAYYDRKAEEEAKRKALEGETGRSTSLQEDLFGLLDFLEDRGLIVSSRVVEGRESKVQVYD